MDEFNLTQSDIANLTGSWISEEWARRAKLRRVHSQEGGELIGRNGAGNYAGIVFANFWPGETQAREFCIRRDNPDIEFRADGTRKEVKKYLWPPGRGSQLYFFPETKPEHLQDVNLPIVLTEGAKKVIALYRLADQPGQSLRFLPIGIPGVYNWHGTVGKEQGPNGERRDQKGLIPDFGRVLLKGRRFTICYDSDVKTNRHVQDARSRLARTLRSRGAIVLFMEVPDAGGQKQGVDDWLSKPGAAADVLDAFENASSGDVPGVPTNYFVDKSGVYIIDNQGERKSAWLSARLDVVAYARTRNGDQWSKVLQWEDLDGNEHTLIMPNGMLAGEGSDLQKQLRSGGLVMARDKILVGKLLNYIDRCSPRRFVKLAQKIGWDGQAFVLPDGTISAEDGEEVIYQEQEGANANYLKSSGTLHEWMDAIARPSSGNSRLVFGICLAFAPPLLRLCGELGGGFHLRGSSSVGKSTALIVAGSVWGGGGKDGFIRSWRTTTNGLETTALLHNDGLLCLDELGQVDPFLAADATYTLANGFSKNRATRNGAAKPISEWLMLFLSTGELSLASHVSTAGKRTKGGQEVRMPEIPADAGANLGIFEKLPEGIDAATFVGELRVAATSLYGTPIREYLSQLVSNQEKWISEVERYRVEFKKRLKKEEYGTEVNRTIDRFSLVAAAGTIATSMGITGWKETEATLSAQKCFNAWLNARGSFGAHDVEQAISHICSLILSSPDRFRVIGPSAPDQQKVGNQLGFAKKGPNGIYEEYCFFVQIFRDEVCEGYDPDAVLAELRNRKLLRLVEKDRNTVRISSPDHGENRLRVYAIRGEIVRDGNPERD